MSLVSGPLPMTDSPASLERRASVIPSPSSTRDQYPPGVRLQCPRPVTYVPFSSHNPSGLYSTGATKAHGSVSSGESSSSAMSEYKSYFPDPPYSSSTPAERALMKQQQQRPPQQQQGSTVSHAYLGRGGQERSNRAYPEMVEDHSAVFRYIQPREVVEEEEQDHAFWILAWLSFLDPIHCLFSALVAIIALLILLVSLPVLLCRPQSSLSTSLIRVIAPVFRHHLQMLCAPSVDNAHTFDFSPVGLVLVQLTSPILSIGVALVSWIVAVFWLFALIMGNPDGTEKRDDGRAAVLMVRDWWERYFLYAIRR